MTTKPQLGKRIEWVSMHVLRRHYSANMSAGLYGTVSCAFRLRLPMTLLRYDVASFLHGHQAVVPYQYERGEHRRKHCWKRDRADFIQQQGHLVGKCPSTITDSVAQTLLNQAVPEPDPFLVPGRAVDSWPKRLFCVHKGVIYEGVPTEPGKSYHGYPWRGREGRGPLPTQVIDHLRALAKAEGYLDEFESWLAEHS